MNWLTNFVKPKLSAIKSKIIKKDVMIIAIIEWKKSLFAMYLSFELYFLYKKINPQIITGKITTKKVNLIPHPNPIKIEDKSKFLIIFSSSEQCK